TCHSHLCLCQCVGAPRGLHAFPTRRSSDLDGQEVPYSEIAKGYQLPNGETVVLTDEDFEDLPLNTTRMVDVLQFVPLDEVDPIRSEEHTSELQSRENLVCRLLLEKKKNMQR